MSKLFVERGNQENSFGDFIGVAFITAVNTMTLGLSLLVIFDVLNCY